MDMRRVLSLLSAAVLLLLAVSCADDAAVMSELDAAESVMEDSPKTVRPFWTRCSAAGL